MPLVSEVAAHLDRFAPPALAAAWDNTGLLVGDGEQSLIKVLTCLTVTPEVVAEAVAEGVGLIVTHHPVLFKGAKKLTTDTTEGRLLIPLLRAGVAVYSPHTAFDNCDGGINDALAKRFGLEGVRPLRRGSDGSQIKLVAFVPEADLAAVSDALFAAGAGTIGHYKECSFRAKGAGTFHGDDTTRPSVGKKNRREEADEYRLEVVVPAAKADAAVAALKASHSYEEPAFDLYPLRANPSGGEGRIGTLKRPVPLDEFAEVVRAACSSDAVQVGDDGKKPVRTVAVACGAAGEFLADAVAAGADAFVTGEMRFHDVLAADAAGIAVVLPGHYATERPAVEELAVRLGEAFPALAVWASRRERDPLRWRPHSH